MRRLNALGRETLILKRLDTLADNTEAIYRRLLEDCQKNRSSEDRNILRELFAWLAYTKDKFTIADANMLISIMQNENALSIEEELEGRLSSLLRISGSRTSDESGDSNTEDDDGESTDGSDPDTVEIEEEAITFLSFQDRSLKRHFCCKTQDQAISFQCTSAEGQVIVFRACSTILVMPKKDDGLESSSLERYASEWLFYHLACIPIERKEEIDDMLAGVVLESIYKVLTNKNNALRQLEKEAGDRGNHGDVLGGYGIVEGSTLELLSRWAYRAQDLTPKQLPLEVQEWLRPLRHEPLSVFIPLSRAHISNWFSAKSPEDAYCAFISAHCALQKGRNLPELTQDPSIGKYLDEFAKGEGTITDCSFEIVANCYSDILKTPSSYNGIGMAMRYKDMYEPAIEQLTKGLAEATITKAEQFRLLSSKAHNLLELGRNESDDQKRRFWLEQSLVVHDQAQSAYHDMKKAGELNKDLEDIVCWTLKNNACAAALLGKSKQAVAKVREALETNGVPDMGDIIELVAALNDDGQFLMIIQLLEEIPKVTAAEYLLFGGFDLAQEAAARVGRGRFLLGLYSSLQRVAEVFVYSGATPRFQWAAAIFARQALGDLGLAKKLLTDMIDHPACTDSAILEGCNQLSEIMLEEFRSSSDPMIKQQALDITLKLLDTPTKLLSSNEYEPTQSHILITAAIMLRRLGPSLEFQNCLEAAFRNCMDELQDDTGCNNLAALRRLARVLSCIPGFDQFTSIALTAQFYVIGNDVRRKDLESDRESGTDDTQDPTDTEEPFSDAFERNGIPQADCNGSGGLVDSIRADDVSLVKRQGHQRSKSNASAAPDEMEESLLDSAEVSCKVCKKDIRDFSHGAVYYCIYCIDCDICENCFLKRGQRDRGEIEPDWRVVCPSGHKNVKAPVEGWRGMKNGSMRIGNAEIPFKEWLTHLETKWTEYWKSFWTETDLL
jgi:hypothetical protein